MSTFALKRGYELQLPTSFVEIDREEMDYIDGSWGVPQALINVTKCIFAGILGTAVTKMFGVSSWAASVAVGAILDMTWVGAALKSAAMFVWSPKGIAIITVLAFATVTLAAPFVARRR